MSTINRTWRAGIAQRVTLGLVAILCFALAAGFLGAPFFWYALHGGDSLSAMIAMSGAGFLFVMGLCLYIVFTLISVLRTRISLAGTTLDATLPQLSRRRFVPSFRRVTLEVAQIRSVEKRREISSTLGLSTLRESLSIVIADNERIGFFSNTLGAVRQLPLDEIAAAIASAAGIAVTDDGTVLTKATGMYGQTASSWSEVPLDDKSAKKAQRRAYRTLRILVGLMLLMLLMRAFFNR